MSTRFRADNAATTGGEPTTRFTPSGANLEELRRMFADASVLITGGTGSFGQEFVRRVLQIAVPKRLIVFSRDEYKQTKMQQRPEFCNQEVLRFFIGDVRDEKRLEMALRDVDYVIHAAALKQVPVAEYNPFECIRTNVIGAENVIRAAMTHRVKRVIALSTDKACSPINLYGASKLAADKLFVAAGNLAGSTRVRYAVVRYGNVFGSRGSVVPFFRQLIDNGAKALPITDRRMTRFIITLLDGVDFVLSSLVSMRGGEIFVPKLPSVRITDIADAMAPDLEREIVGIRPGEKLHEAMISKEDARTTLDLGDRYVMEPAARMFMRESFADEGCPRVPEDFGYSSELNDHWLSIEDIRELLKTHGHA